MHNTSREAADDVRMRGFAQRHTVDAALAWLDAQLQPLAAEVVPLRSAAGRVLATSVVSDVDVPGFDRATMDGYAVVADSTEGATCLQPAAADRHRRFDAWLRLLKARLRGRSGSHHDWRTDAARHRRGAACRMGGGGAQRPQPAQHQCAGRRLTRKESRQTRRRHRPRHDVVRARTRVAPTGSGCPQLRRPGTGARDPPTACTPRGDRQRTAAIRLAPTWLSYCRCQRADARGAYRARRRSGRLPRPGSRRSRRHPRGPSR